jgi:signal peptidase II
VSEITVSRRNTVLFAIAYTILLIGLVVLDQSTKFHAEKLFLAWSHPSNLHAMQTTAYNAITLGTQTGSGNWFEFNFTYVRNTGAIWGLMGNLPRGASNIFFLILYPIFMILLGFTFRTSKPGQRLLRFSIVCILSGAVGNFIDRSTVGYVIDWMHPQWRLFGWSYSYPVFNIADAAIVSGVALWFLDGILETRATKRLTASA